MVKRKLKHGSSNCLSRLVHWLRYLMMMMMMMAMMMMRMMMMMLMMMMMMMVMMMTMVAISRQTSAQKCKSQEPRAQHSCYSCCSR